MLRAAVLVVASLIAACGPPGNSGSDGGLDTCTPGAQTMCYSGAPGTEGNGPCRSGMATCDATGNWGPCEGEITPTQESCTDGVDNNCNGAIDENEDRDGDGVTTCDGDCCDSTECSAPALVNAGAFDAPGDGVDNDCNGAIDDAQLLCDSGLPLGTQADATAYAKAIDICQTATMTEKKWGVISAALSLADGTGTPATKAHAVRDHFGTGVQPQGGVRLALLSTGAAAGKNDTNPAYQDFQTGAGLNGNNLESNFPAEFSTGIPNAPGCPSPAGNKAYDPVMLTLTVRVPTNAKSFKLMINFFSSEFPEFTCSQFNDFFAVFLDSTYAGQPANPADKNLAFYSAGGMTYPVGVNLAAGNTGLFTQCKNGTTGCAQGVGGSISTCTGTEQLVMTGLDTASPNVCNQDSLQGGGTGWLETTGNVVPGEIMTLRIVIWDTSDHRLDSIAVIDGFQWQTETATPGTVIP